MKNRFYFAVFISALATAAVPALAASYSVTDLGLGSAIGINTSGQVLGLNSSTGNDYIYNSSASSFNNIGALGARSINDLGQVCGNVGNAIYMYDGSIHNYGVPLGGTAPCKAYNLNSAGQITGQVGVGGGVVHGFVYNPGSNSFTDLGTLSGVSTDTAYGSSINPSGQIEGDSTASNGNTHAFIWTNGVMLDLQTFGGPSSSGIHVNNAAHATGTAQESNSGVTPATWISHIFYWDGTTLNDCGILPGDNYGNAGSMNNSNVIVGYCTPNALSASNLERAVIYNGSLTDLNTLIPGDAGFTLTSATGINDAGQIVADGYDSNGVQHALLLDPTAVPEPASLGVLGAASMVLMFRRSRRGGER